MRPNAAADEDRRAAVIEPTVPLFPRKETTDDTLLPCPSCHPEGATTRSSPTTTAHRRALPEASSAKPAPANATTHTLPRPAFQLPPDAAAVAEENARRLGLGTRADFRVGDWAAGLDGPFDVIVSNPPYIADGMRAELAPEVRDFDPPGALFAGAEGLDAYRIIAPQAAKLLAPGGLIGFEIGQGQDAAVAEILRANGFEGIESRADLAGIPRALSGRAPSP